MAQLEPAELDTSLLFRQRSRPAAWFLAVAVTLLASASFSQGEGANEAADTPEGAIHALHEALADMAAQYGDAGVDERYRSLEPIVSATHDLPYIAELSIRRQWGDLTDDERRRFVAAFERLSVTTYASRFRNLRRGMFAIDASEPAGGERAHVTATLTTADGDTIPFQYVLHDTGEGWKIVNILADNVSDLALKRAEYRRLLQDGSIDDLIADLERQTVDAVE
jgi:phospholipid transport system substrate-binding protein